MDGYFWLAGRCEDNKPIHGWFSITYEMIDFWIQSSDPTSSQILVREGDRVMLYAVHGGSLAVSSEGRPHRALLYQKIFYDSQDHSCVFAIPDNAQLRRLCFRASPEALEKMKSPDTHPKIRELLVLLFGTS